VVYLAHCRPIEIGASKRIRKRSRNRITRGGAFFTVLPSSRGYPEDPVRLEVQVPTVGKPSKSEDSDTQVSEEVQNNLKRGLSSNL
jgi:hypothetical protein